MKKLIIVLSVAAVAIISCKKDNADDVFPDPPACDTSNVTFSAVIKPIIQAKCLSCHTGTSGTGYDLSTYNGMEAVASHGQLLPAINHTGPKPMPQGQPKLDDCSIAKITKWVNDGAPNN